MNAQEIRQAYLDFFKQRGHVIVPRAKLVPDNDPTTLFTGSGMQPMIPYLLGEEHPLGVRLADSQTCIRAQDIDEIGDNRHTTFFEMLGNWSLGDYFKKEQIPWMFEFLVDVVGLDPERFYVTCFIGAPEYNIPKDTEAADIWVQEFKKRGLSHDMADIGSEEQGAARGINPGERIFFYDSSKNWWSRNGKPENTPIGDPCGPDSEMFYDFGTPHDPAYGEYCHPNCDCGRFMEMGNNVFMAYKKVGDGVFEPLEKPNIDQGSGLERFAAAVLNEPDVYKISLLWPIIEKLQALSGKPYESHTNAMRVIADHLRGAAFLAVDGIAPSNKEQGYVMRRLLRRAIRYSFDLGIEQNFLQEVVPIVTAMYRNDYPEVAEREQQVIETLVKEEHAFRTTLKSGIKELNKRTQQLRLVFIYPDGSRSLLPNMSNPPTAYPTEMRKVLTGKDVFDIYETHGYPMELTAEWAVLNDVLLLYNSGNNWIDEFEFAKMEQRQRSQTAQKGTFKGGLEGHDPIHIKYHTATHLMYKALRLVLGDGVVQRGSNITADRLRFDFSHPEKVTREQLNQVEQIVNEQIKKDLPVFWKEYPTDEAFELGAMGAFGDKYGEKVKVYQVGEGDQKFSFEICGGPHVERTGVLAEGGKTFAITKEEASSAGVRRIKAVLR